jgi:hypothetical protein
MPFGLCNAAQTLQRLQDNLFQKLPFVFVYIDYGDVGSRNLDEQVEFLLPFFAKNHSNPCTFDKFVER